MLNIKLLIFKISKKLKPLKCIKLQNHTTNQGHTNYFLLWSTLYFIIVLCFIIF